MQTQFNKNAADLFFKPAPGYVSELLNRHGAKRYRKGEVIFHTGEASEYLYFVVSGKVKLSVMNPENKEITKAILGTGELFGELAITGELTRHDQALALEDTVLRSLHARDMLALLQGRPDLTLYLMQLMAKRQVAMERRLESLVFRDSRSRIVEFLVEFATDKGQPVGYEWVLRKPITHQEIANMTATSRQTVTSTLNDLRALKLLKFNRKQLLIRDIEKLRAEIRA